VYDALQQGLVGPHWAGLAPEFFVGRSQLGGQQVNVPLKLVSVLPQFLVSAFAFDYSLRAFFMCNRRFDNLLAGVLLYSAAALSELLLYSPALFSFLPEFIVGCFELGGEFFNLLLEPGAALFHLILGSLVVSDFGGEYDKADGCSLLIFDHRHFRLCGECCSVFSHVFNGSGELASGPGFIDAGNEVGFHLLLSVEGADVFTDEFIGEIVPVHYCPRFICKADTSVGVDYGDCLPGLFGNSDEMSQCLLKSLINGNYAVHNCLFLSDAPEGHERFGATARCFHFSQTELQ
jgi:hypothetical protein